MSLPSDNLLQPDAYTVSDEQSRGALRCIDRNVRDLPDRIEVAQSLGLLTVPFVVGVPAFGAVPDLLGNRCGATGSGRVWGCGRTLVRVHWDHN